MGRAASAFARKLRRDKLCRFVPVEKWQRCGAGSETGAPAAVGPAVRPYQRKAR